MKSAQPTPATPIELQTLLEQFRHEYDTQRPHESLPPHPQGAYRRIAKPAPPAPPGDR